jgi:hypothetical protein
LVSGQTDNTVDAGLYRPASIGDFVWEDLNGNGQQDSGEPGIVGATVNLLRLHRHYHDRDDDDRRGRHLRLHQPRARQLRRAVRQAERVLVHDRQRRRRCDR